ncbi:MAG: hypothetical protein QNK43_06550 [Amphritea sp.]|nr:hypothetical protein [Amphritea sp.]
MNKIDLISLTYDTYSYIAFTRSFYCIPKAYKNKPHELSGLNKYGYRLNSIPTRFLRQSTFSRIGALTFDSDHRPYSEYIRQHKLHRQLAVTFRPVNMGSA